MPRTAGGASGAGLRPVLVGAAGVVLAVAAAEWTPFRPTPALQRPSEILARFVGLTASGEMGRHVAATCLRLGTGYLVGVAGGWLAAVAVNRWLLLREFATPQIEFIRCLSPLALMPAFMAAFGIGFTFEVAVTSWVAWVPVFLTVSSGFRSVDPSHLRLGRGIGLTPRQIFWKIVVPSSAPELCTGLRISLGAAFLALVAAEMLGCSAGLGFHILESSQTFRFADMYASILAVGILGFAANAALLRVSRAIAPWSDRAAEPA